MQLRVETKVKTITLFISFFIIILAGCELFTESPNDSSPIQRTIGMNGVEYTLSIPQTVFSLEDSLHLTFQVMNRSMETRMFYFNNVQQFGFMLADDFNRVVLYYPNIVSPATSSFVLQPGESKSFEMAYLFKNHNGNFINKGKYQLSAYLTENNSPKVSLRISVN